MDINYKNLLKEQIIIMIVPVLVLVGLVVGLVFGVTKFITSTSDIRSKSEQVAQLQEKKTELEVQLAQLSKEETSGDVKHIFELKGASFGVEASFAPLFDNMLKIAKASGIRIRSVDYNYAPEADPIFAAKIPNVNVCELTTTIVGTYSEIQTFLKTLLFEDYLVNIAKMEIVSWKRDKSILIANLQLRYYTKTE